MDTRTLKEQWKARVEGFRLVNERELLERRTASADELLERTERVFIRPLAQTRSAHDEAEEERVRDLWAKIKEAFLQASAARAGTSP